MASEVRDRVTEWLTSADSCFLIGAGCSFCAGKPLIGQLTSQVLDKVDPSIKAEFGGLKPAGDRSSTIEDLINYLVRYQAILATVTNPTEHKLNPNWIESSLTAIKKEIVGAIVDDWVSSDVHRRFFQRIASHRKPLDIFTLNYDTIIEASLDEMRTGYIDGFRGTNKAWFDPALFDEAQERSPIVRLYKLHGSINWIRDPSGHVRRANIRSTDDLKDQPVVVYPSEQKYVQTQYGVYETLLGRFRNRLRSSGVNDRLVTAGYSFNDDHINEAIIDSICADRSNLTVIAFVGAETNVTAQKARLEAIERRCDRRFNAFVGNSFYVGSALAEEDAKELLSLELWKFEQMVDFVAGAGS